MKGKLLKSQFNDLCLAGLELKENKATLYASLYGGNVVEVNESGVNLQTTGAGRLVLNSTQLYGPGFMYLSTPADFVPFAHAFLPKKTVAPIVEIVEDFKSINQFGSVIIMLGGAL